MKRLACSLAALAVLTSPSFAADAIRIVGSSTVYPFTTAVAEQFAKKNGSPAPIVESTGTGGGVKLFCAGDGPDTPDAVNASREMKPEEVDACNKAGVAKIDKITIGLDAIVLAMSKQDQPASMTTKQIYMALAKYVLLDGKWVENPSKTWSDLDPSLPAEKIEVLGPPPTSGTRDSFVEMVFDKECKAAAKEAGITLSADDEKKYCKSVREDGAYVEAGENDNLIVQKLQANPSAMGIFGYSFLEQNQNTIQGVTINGATPDYDSVEAGKYPLARKLYVYFKGSHLASNPDLNKFKDEYLSDAAIGEEGYLVDKGLIPIIK